jgi:hypothetical protein
LKKLAKPKRLIWETGIFPANWTLQQPTIHSSALIRYFERIRHVLETWNPQDFEKLEDRQKNARLYE